MIQVVIREEEEGKSNRLDLGWPETKGGGDVGVDPLCLPAVTSEGEKE